MTNNNNNNDNLYFLSLCNFHESHFEPMARVHYFCVSDCLTVYCNMNSELIKGNLSHHRYSLITIHYTSTKLILEVCRTPVTYELT